MTDATRCSFCAGIYDYRQMHALAVDGLGFMAECPACHPCAEDLRSQTAGLGVEVIVSGYPPLVDGPYTTDPFTCPHGITYWLEPSGEQIAQWVKDRVR